jgi:hypothetical protein
MLSTVCAIFNTISSPVGSGLFCPKFLGGKSKLSYASLRVFSFGLYKVVQGYYTFSPTFPQVFGAKVSNKTNNQNTEK